ncbi:membrane-bound alkaline phosphatase-like isoform X2 [Pectinophora gossypiella]|uniref:membrane-bound alkaline phosphatase-like isoform X2 n=1 Tax=Pectinophora gossypiella TaxID=13191 RepID=UPI00214EE1C0|nr:membrane-bound alkaline phosphatase-like isoform X2 [Pectinophora gossypiella]
MGTVRLFLLLVLVMVATTRGDRYHPEKNAQNSQQLQRNPDAFNTAERTPEFWKNSAKAGIETRLKDIRNDKLARNVIMFLGDGMSIPTLMAARTLKGQRQNRTGEETELFFETFPSVGLSKTYCLDKQIPDSACTATAYLAGIKNNYETVGVDGRVQRGDCLASADKSTHLDSIAAWALDDGRDAGIVTTTRVTHASPSGTYARSAHRDWESDANVTQAGFTTDVCPDIAMQLITTSPGNKFKADKATDPTLAELTEVAINSLSRNEKGYFLFVEGGRTDHAHHDNWAQMALDETLEFDLAIEKAVEMVGDDTLIVVTADHAHVMAINGYTKRGGDILGPSDDLGGDNVPYMTLSYTNGPGARPHVDGNRVDVTKEDFMDLEWRSHADVFLEWETHGGDDVAVMAWGPHHHLFTGVYEQSHIPFRMAYAACIGPGLHADACSSASLLHPLSLLYAIVLAALYHTAQW